MSSASRASRSYGSAAWGKISRLRSAPRWRIAGWIALARIDVAHADVGTEVEVGQLDGHIKRYPAKVASFPHYDPQKTRPRS